MQDKSKYVTFKQAKLLFEKGYNEPTVYPFINGEIDFDRSDLLDGSDLYIDYNYRYNGESMDVRGEVFSAPLQSEVIEWLKVNHKINVEANYLSNIGKYRWLAKPMNIIPKSFKTIKEYAIAVNKYYGKEDFNSPQEAYSVAFDYILNNLI